MSLMLVHDISVKQGGFATVFLSPNEGRVFKLFKSYRHPEMQPNRGSIEDRLRRAVFDSELEALKIADGTDRLLGVVPKFLGAITVDGVRDALGGDISNWYLLDCCLVLEMVEGKDVKFDKVRSQYGHIEQWLHAAGINHTIDMSIFIGSNNELKVIDFATRDAYLDEELKLP